MHELFGFFFKGKNNCTLMYMYLYMHIDKTVRVQIRFANRFI
jgi:hypothetical protein